MVCWSKVFFLSQIILNFVGLINSQPDFLGYVCGLNVTTASEYEANKNNTHATPLYEANKATLLSSLSSKIDKYGFYGNSVGKNYDRVSAIVLCRADVGLTNCRSCVNNSASKIMQVCGNYSEALGWYDSCMIRFSNKTILRTVSTGPAIYVWNLNDVSNVVEFNKALISLFNSLRNKAASGDSLLKVATGNISVLGSQKIYALMQCTPDLSESQCMDCLEVAVGQIPGCCNGKLGVRILTPSCNFRYELGRFYNDIPATPPTPSCPHP